MTNLDLGKMFGDSNQEMQKAAALKTYLVKLDEILPSEENPYEVEEESVQRLAENIKQYGLFQALTAQKEGTEIRLISGERRYTALKYLADSGKAYTYNGEDITGYAPVSYVKQATGDAKTMMMISSITGIKEHYVKDYLASKNREIKFAEEDPETIAKIRQSKQVSEEEKAYKELLKQINKCIKKFEKLDSYVLATLSEDELNTFQSKCFELSLHLQECTANGERELMS